MGTVYMAEPGAQATWACRRCCSGNKPRLFFTRRASFIIALSDPKLIIDIPKLVAHHLPAVSCDLPGPAGGRAACCRSRARHYNRLGVRLLAPTANVGSGRYRGDLRLAPRRLDAPGIVRHETARPLGGSSSLIMRRIADCPCGRFGRMFDEDSAIAWFVDLRVNA
jgi:hypothetical protein